jgi:hypothetical protein
MDGDDDLIESDDVTKDHSKKVMQRFVFPTRSVGIIKPGARKKKGKTEMRRESK